MFNMSARSVKGLQVCIERLLLERGAVDTLLLAVLQKL